MPDLAGVGVDFSPVLVDFLPITSAHFFCCPPPNRVSLPAKSLPNPMQPSAKASMTGRTSIESLDLAALTEAVDIVWLHPERRRELRSLIRKRGWQAAAEVAAFDVQCRALNLPPWEAPPCVASVRGKDRAARLLRRMLRRGVSRWHPRPLAAIAEAGVLVRSAPVIQGGKREPVFPPSGGGSAGGARH
jgi:hypothetical protein